MADLSQTAASVKLKAQTVTSQMGQAGEAITQGMPVYLKAADSKYYKADADTLAESTAVGIALTPAATSGYFYFATSGDIDVGATLTVGLYYYVSTNAGAIAPIGDLSTGDFPTILGGAVDSSTLRLDINSLGIAKA
jgi:hypothetical protein